MSPTSCPVTLACQSCLQIEGRRALPPTCHHNTVQSPLMPGRLTTGTVRANKLGYTQAHLRPGYISSTRAAGQLISPSPNSGVSLACRLLQGAQVNLCCEADAVLPHVFWFLSCQTASALPCMLAAPTCCQGI